MRVASLLELPFTLICLAFALFFYYCGFQCRPSGMLNETEEMIGRIQCETGLAFPDDAAILAFFEPDRAIDPIWLAKIEIPASHYTAFACSLASKPDDHTLFKSAYADSLSFWTPTNVVAEKQYLPNDHRLVRILVSHDSEVYIAYVECMVF